MRFRKEKINENVVQRLRKVYEETGTRAGVYDFGAFHMFTTVMRGPDSGHQGLKDFFTWPMRRLITEEKAFDRETNERFTLLCLARSYQIIVEKEEHFLSHMAIAFKVAEELGYTKRVKITEAGRLLFNDRFGSVLKRRITRGMVKDWEMFR